jgi:ATP-binding cassette subfamily B protein
VLKHRLRWHEWRLKNTESERRTWYYTWVLTDRETAAELRIFDLGHHFQSLFDTLRGKLRGERKHLAWDQGVAELGAGVIALVISGAAMALMLWRAMMGVLTLGDLALFYQAFQQVQGGVSSLFENLGEIYSNSLFLTDLFEFLSLESTITAPTAPEDVPAPLQTGIHFDQVTFHYPDSQRVALSDFNLAIPARGIVAIVGANGAGKSTVIKLLCRFYDPNQGRILLDGVDLRELDPRELRRQITILFQEPVHYQNSAVENIAFGDLTAETDLQQVRQAARAAGAAGPIERLPQGYDTQLGNWFKGGTELSVGEWQRLALARAYWRRAPILVLDEPTSAMDPWAEHDWLQRFRALAAGSIALIITHRFTTAMHADIIHVIDEGRVVESGSHEELLARGGRYAQSWREQMRASTDGRPNSQVYAGATPLNSGSNHAEPAVQPSVTPHAGRPI